MAVTLPYRSESIEDRPSDTAGFANGRIPEHLLFEADIAVTKQDLVFNAAIAYRELAEEFTRIDGRQLCVTYGGMYRSYDGQVSLFRDRYKPISTAAAAIRGFRNCKFWNGTWWLLDTGEAMAAVPGTSNHGWGLALDLALYVGGRIVSLDDKALTLLARLGPKYGYWPTVRSEPWHWVYLLGDLLPSVIAVTVPKPTLRRGMKGRDVRALERILYELKYQPMKPNSIFGPRTEKALIKLQRDLNVPVTKVYDQRTAAALEGLLEYLTGLEMAS